MKKIAVMLPALIMVLIFTVHGQQVNGQKVSFPKGKDNWSDTIFKKLLTKQMKKAGDKPVMLGIRVKLVNESSYGKWYDMEITNKSNDQKVKFDISNRQDTYTVKLKPHQAKVVELLNLNTLRSESGEDDYFWEYPGMDFLKE
jgi:hypothetical protein